ncbi:hypothetical protein [Paenibacillus sp. 1-18]|uniref:hypothetical protein n=1 Tax=Paenibacillus sp. 1-18 TaxID=1333846 RepID=UPI000472788E|nr:hypothetical protein [Paenibacillus sp. 1-18]
MIEVGHGFVVIGELDKKDFYKLVVKKGEVSKTMNILGEGVETTVNNLKQAGYYVSCLTRLAI